MLGPYVVGGALASVMVVAGVVDRGLSRSDHGAPGVLGALLTGYGAAVLFVLTTLLVGLALGGS